MNTMNESTEIFFSPLAQKAGAHFGAASTPFGRARLLAAMEARQSALKLPAFSDYAAFLRREPLEWARLWPQALACEGAFFRPAAQFEVARDLLSEWSIMAENRSLRALSLGCGSGFETCSLAMMLEESGLRAKSWQVEIFGLDLNEEAIRQAEAAVFTERDMEWLTEAQRRKWFMPRGGGWRFKSALAPAVTLAVANVYDEASWPQWATAAPFDIIFCRALSLEAPPKTPRGLARVLRGLLAPTGFIFTAPGEFLPDNSGELYLEERGGVTYYRRGRGRFKANRAHLSKKQLAGRAAKHAPDTGLSPLDAREEALLAEARALLEEARPEEARALLIEIITTQMERGRPQPEAWDLLARAEEALGRPETARATRDALGGE